MLGAAPIPRLFKKPETCAPSLELSKEGLMQRIFVVLVVIMVVGVSLGLYLGWFHVTISVDADKFHEDSKAAQEKVLNLGQGNW